MDDALLDIRFRPALQQPTWDDESEVRRVRKELASRRPLVRAKDVRTLRTLLGRVAAGEAHVVQSGDCAEDPEERTPGDVLRKAALLDLLAGTMKMATHKPVVRVGRIAGQFCKPRSHPTERIGDLDLPVYRGHMVNRPEPAHDYRRHDARHILSGYLAASDIMERLGWRDPTVRSAIDAPVWTSHEALLLDYEIPMLRRDAAGQLFLSSTHWPWIGERTRQVDGAHVALLTAVVNPVACKIGPGTEVDELLALCARLDPRREPGRLTLIARMGAESVAVRLPPLVAAVRDAGHPVIWIADPMHGNTVITPEGLKTRFLESIAREIQDFQCVVRTGGGVAGGLHLETTPDDVTECVVNESAVEQVGDKYTTFCDPRLNPAQAVAMASVWQG